MKSYLKIVVVSLILTLFVDAIFSKSFAMGKQAREDTAKTTQVPKVKKKAKMYSKETGKPYERTKADSLRVEEVNKKMIEEQVKNLRPEVPGLIKRLNNENIDARMWAVNGLEYSRDPRAIEPLLAVLKNDPISTIRSDAARALETICLYLGKKYSIQAIPGLREALKDETIRVSYTTARTLIHIGDKSTPIPTLVSIFRKKPDIFRASIEVWVKQEVVRPDLPDSEQIQLAEKWKKEAPLYALDLLIKIGNEEVVVELENCVNDKDQWISSKAVESLSQIRKKNKSQKEAK